MSTIKLLTQGAEGRVYRSQWLGQDVIIKQRFKKKYRHPDLDAHITKERIKAEAKFLVRCRTIGIKVPALLDVNLHSNELIMENIHESCQLRQYIINKYGKLELLESLCKSIGKILYKLHSNNIIHGDLTTSNMLIQSVDDQEAIYLIDFGLSSVSDKAEDKAVDLYVFERAMLSTHPDSEPLIEHILDSYKCSGANANNVIRRLDEVRLRGRKRVCFG